MIIIADSGSSKIDWRLLQKDGTVGQASSAGFNPYYQPVEHLRRIIHEIIVPLASETVTKIFFYGTGVSSEKNQDVVRAEFLTCFPVARVEIEWDLVAAAPDASSARIHPRLATCPVILLPS